MARLLRVLRRQDKHHCEGLIFASVVKKPLTMKLMMLTMGEIPHRKDVRCRKVKVRSGSYNFVILSCSTQFRTQ